MDGFGGALGLSALPVKDSSILGFTMKVVVLTTVHNRHDTRVFYKECPAISGLADVELTVVVADGRGDEFRDGFAILDVGTAGGGRAGRFTFSSARAVFAILKLKPNIVHFHDPELIPACCIFAAFGIKVIYDVHEDVPQDILDKFWIPRYLRRPVANVVSVLEWFASKIFWKIIVATPSIGSRFPARKTEIVQNFPMLEEFRFFERLKPCEERRDFVYIGAITEIRGLTEAVEAISLLPESDRARLVLAGGFSPDAYKEVIAEKDGWVRVDYRGVVARSGLSDLFTGCTAGIVTLWPAHNHINSQPNKLFEYMAAGVPVIASDFPLWRKIISDVGCGVLVDPLEPKSIVGAMRYLLENPREGKAMGERGRKAVVEQYNWGVELKRLQGIYKSAMEDE